MRVRPTASPPPALAIQIGLVRWSRGFGWGNEKEGRLVVNRVVGGAACRWRFLFGSTWWGRGGSVVQSPLSFSPSARCQNRLSAGDLRSPRVLLLNSNASVNSQNPKLLATSTCEQHTGTCTYVSYYTILGRTQAAGQRVFSVRRAPVRVRCDSDGSRPVLHGNLPQQTNP